jgi:SAM-dependent methyltransferase
VKLCPRCGSATGDDWHCPSCGFEPELFEGIPCLAPEAVGTTEGFDPEAFERLARTEQGSFWFRSRNRLIVWALDRYFPRARSMLEIGCGTGYVLSGVAAARPAMTLAGAELHPQGLRFARERVPQAAFVQLDATRMPYDGEWDVVGAFDVLEHIEDDEAALAGMIAATRAGGGVVITVPQHGFLWSQADDYARHARRYSRSELVEKVERAGLRVVRATSFVSILLPVMYASRWRERVGRRQYDPAREHASAARVPLLERALDAERAVIRRGVDLPAGGSLLLVAERP